MKKLMMKAAIAMMRLVYSFFKLRKTENKITFISRQQNTPTVDFLTLEKKIKEKFPDCETVILTKRLEGKASYIGHMLTQMKNMATSRTVILDSYCIAVSVLKHKKDLRVIQMWHAMGSMKKFGYAMIDKEEGSPREVAETMKMHAGYDTILISSMSFIKDYIEGFRCDPAAVKEIPLPKADLLTDTAYRIRKVQKIYDRYPQLKKKSNIIYCPTFRKNGDSKAGAAVKKLLDSIDFDRFNLIYKPHPLSRMTIDDPRVITDFKDPFEMLFVSDYAITDYSSIMYEAGLLRMPVFLYAYDWDEYSSKRELNIDLQHDAPCMFTSDPKEIIDAIEKDADGSAPLDLQMWNDFIKDNIHMPAGSTCCDEIIKLL